MLNKVFNVHNNISAIEKAAGVISSGLRPIWLPTLDTLRNLFYAPTAEMKITFDLLRQASLVG